MPEAARCSAARDAEPSGEGAAGARLPRRPKSDFTAFMAAAERRILAPEEAREESRPGKKALRPAGEHFCTRDKRA
jgi:hypothetical protein